MLQLFRWLVHVFFVFGDVTFLLGPSEFFGQVAPGMLITFLQKGLAYVGIEEHLNEVSR